MVKVKPRFVGLGTWVDDITTKKVVYLKGRLLAMVVVGDSRVLLTYCLHLVQ